MGKTLWLWLGVMLVPPTLGTPTLGTPVLPPKMASLSEMGLQKPRVSEGREWKAHLERWNICTMHLLQGAAVQPCRDALGTAQLGVSASQLHPWFIEIISSPRQHFISGITSKVSTQYWICLENQECLNVWGSSSGISLRTPVQITWISCRLTWENPSPINTIRNRGQRTKICAELSPDKDLQGILAGNV